MCLHSGCHCVQVVEGHASRIRQSSAAEQAQALGISFSHVAQGLQAGLYQDPELLKQDVQEICRAAAEAYCSSEQVTYNQAGLCMFGRTAHHAWVRDHTH